MWKNDGKKLLSKFRNVVRNHVRRKRVRRKKTGLESWWWNDETESTVRENIEILNIWKRTGACRKRQCRVQDSEGTATSVAARVKADAIEGLYDQVETVEGQRDRDISNCSCKGLIRQGHMPDTQCKICNRRSFFEG